MIQKPGRFLFNVVQFPNDDCITKDDSFIGTCYTAEECSTLKGQASGPCASAFGICCLFKAECDETISKNKTHFRNPNFPLNFEVDQNMLNSQNFQSTTQRRCSANVKRCDNCINDSICFLRLDFVSFSIFAGTGSVDVDSVCQDTFEVQNLAGGNHRIPTICGFNTGEHIYIDIGASRKNDIAGFAATLQFSFAKVIGARSFNVRVSQLDCNSKETPPAGCLQYHTEIQGRLTTWNFNNPQQPSAHLDQQEYKICLRQELDHCCVEFRVCNDENSFSIDNTWYNLFDPGVAVFNPNDEANNDVSQPVVLSSSSCTKDFIEIESSGETCSRMNTNNRYCGFVFTNDIFVENVVSMTDGDGKTTYSNVPTPRRDHRTICDCTPPFGVAIRASNEDRLGLRVAEINAMSVSGQIWDFEDANSVARGVCLNYEHKKCGP